MIYLDKISTEAPKDLSKKKIKEKTEKMAEEIAELQITLLAEQKHSLLVVLQGMDASGKNSSAKAAFEQCSPEGVDSYSFKAPTEEELQHDFLWRIHKQVPRKGYIQLFNRSHYEDILIQRVHKWITEEQVHQRMQAINAFETLLQHDNQTTILKFYLHLSQEEQQKELQERIDDPSKNWKHNANDWEEAKHWDEYRKAYEYAINESVIPWHIIPADNAWYRNYLVTKTILETLQGLDMVRPTLKDRKK
ncbi:PPK2 family polyphosphate kinase [Membranihabitans marinus]|uniref:PPK2 family polyphosphate kinase n=1 Tax=Membranihabitans marinus TaxID=1227546 RepID=UPI001F171706|nr:PPK2 family polyphosphate kinase [Membranihabitans marinus]